MLQNTSSKQEHQTLRQKTVRPCRAQYSTQRWDERARPTKRRSMVDSQQSARTTHHLIMQRHNPGYRSYTSTQRDSLSSVPSMSPLEAFLKTRVLPGRENFEKNNQKQESLAACDSVPGLPGTTQARARPSKRRNFNRYERLGLSQLMMRPRIDETVPSIYTCRLAS